MKLLRFAAIALLATIPMVACDDNNDPGTTPVTIVGTISGTVSVGGTGLAGVTVNLVGAASQSATTGAGGTYSFTNVPAGTYGVQISGGPADVAFATSSSVVTIATSGQTVTADFSGNYITTSSIRGSVTSGTGTGIVATITGTGPTPFTTSSNTAGTFEQTGLRAGDYTVTVSDYGTATIDVTTRTVTVNVGQSANVSFVGTVEEVTTAATVTIGSVTIPGGGGTAILAALAGVIDVNLTIDEGSEALVKAEVLLDGVSAGSYTFSTGAPAEEDGPEAATRSATIQINTAAYSGDGSATCDALPAGTACYTNGPKVLSASVTTSSGATASATNSTSVTFANVDALIATVTPEMTAVSTSAVQWWGGDLTVDVMGVVYSGKTLGSVSMVYNMTGPALVSAVVDAAAPFQRVITNDLGSGGVCGAGGAGLLCGYQSGTGVGGADGITIGAATYSDGTGFPAPTAANRRVMVGGTSYAGNVVAGNFPIWYDNVAPSLQDPLVAGNLFALPERLLANNKDCCANDWVTPDFTWATALGKTEDDADGIGTVGGSTVVGVAAAGVGGITATFHAGAPAALTSTVDAYPASTSPADAGIAPTVLNSDVQIRANLVDALGNSVTIPLTASATGVNPTVTSSLGVDGAAPTNEQLSSGAGFVKDKQIYNIATGAVANVLAFTATEDRSGFDGQPVRGSMSMDKEPATGKPWVLGAKGSTGGAINLPATLPVCGATPPLPEDAVGAPSRCVPNGGGAGDGVYTFTGQLMDQAGNAGQMWTVRILEDLAAPGLTNIVPPAAALVGGTAATFNATLTDNHDVGSAQFTFNFAGPGGAPGVPWIPFTLQSTAGDGDAWDGARQTSATASATLPFVASLEQVAGGVPAGGPLETSNVRVIGSDAAGNPTPAALTNNFAAGTVVLPWTGYNAAAPAGKAAGIGTIGTGWAMAAIPGAPNDDLCNLLGVGAANACALAGGTAATGKASQPLVAQVTGAGGTFPNPFAGGTIYFYMVDGAGNHVLLNSQAASGASFTDTGTGGIRTYSWTYNITQTDAANFAAGPLTVYAIGVDSKGAGLQLANFIVTVVAASS